VLDVFREQSAEKARHLLFCPGSVCAREPEVGCAAGFQRTPGIPRQFRQQRFVMDDTLSSLLKNSFGSSFRAVK
jgi:hypothetical protein